MSACRAFNIRSICLRDVSRDSSAAATCDIADDADQLRAELAELKACLRQLTAQASTAQDPRVNTISANALAASVEATATRVPVSVDGPVQHQARSAAETANTIIAHQSAHGGIPASAVFHMIAQAEIHQLNAIIQTQAVQSIHALADSQRMMAMLFSRSDGGR